MTRARENADGARLDAPLLSPALVTPNLGIPSAGVMTNVTGMPLAGLSATGTASATTYLRGDNSWQTAGSTSASDLDSGTLGHARFPTGGTVVQVVNNTTTTTNAIGSSQTTWQSAGLALAITPKRTDSRFLFTSSFGASTGANSGVRFGFQTTGNSVSTADWGIDDDDPVVHRFTEGGANIGNYRTIVINYLIGNQSQSNTTDTITFTIWGRSGSATDLYIGTRDGNTSTRTLSSLTIYEITP